MKSITGVYVRAHRTPRNPNPGDSRHCCRLADGDAAYGEDDEADGKGVGEADVALEVEAKGLAELAVCKGSDVIMSTTLRLEWRTSYRKDEPERPKLQQTVQA